MENLNAENLKNEIQSLIKTLKATGGWVKRGDCEGWFNHEILADALALINSQEQRIKELAEENERLRADTIEEYRQKVNTKMGKHTHLLGKEYVQRILREVKKEMVGDNDV